MDAEYVYIRSTVEHPGGIDEEWCTVPRTEWDAMTQQKRNDLCVEVAVGHQNNVAPCGAQDVSDPEDVPDAVRENPKGYLV